MSLSCLSLTKLLNAAGEVATEGRVDKNSGEGEQVEKLRIEKIRQEVQRLEDETETKLTSHLSLPRNTLGDLKIKDKWKRCVLTGESKRILWSDELASDTCELCTYPDFPEKEYAHHLLTKHFRRPVPTSGEPSLSSPLLISVPRERFPFYQTNISLPLEPYTRLLDRSERKTQQKTSVLATIRRQQMLSFGLGTFDMFQVWIEQNELIWVISFRTNPEINYKVATDRFEVRFQLKTVVGTRIFSKIFWGYVYPFGSDMNEFFFLELVGKSLPDYYMPKLKVVDGTKEATLNVQVFYTSDVYRRRVGRTFEIKV